MFIKKFDNILPAWTFHLLDWMIYFQPLQSLNQDISDSYPSLWKLIQNDIFSNEKMLDYINIYYQKARKE